MVRVASGVVLAAVTLAAVLLLPVLALRVLVCLVAGLAAREFVRIAGSNELSIAAVVFGCWIASAPTPHLDLVVWLVLMLVAGLVLARGDALQTAAAGAFAVAYIGVPLGLLVAVHAVHGWRATLLLIATVAVSDTSQYYTGRQLGRRPLAPAISPKKTIEGALGGLVCGTLFVTFAGPWAFPGAPRAALALLGLTSVVLGICGDLFESRLKRAAGVKDSSTLIPGHGGVLDRIDALLFVTPAFYFFVELHRL